MQERFVPLAITIAEDGYGCVAGLDEAQRWIRPEPILASDIVAPDTPYHCYTWLGAELGAAEVEDPRPEDRSLSGRPVALGRLTPGERAALLQRALDPTVARAFEDRRTVGLVRVEVERVYVWQWVAQQRFVRITFSDATGARHDWLAPDLRITRACLGAGAPTSEATTERVTQILAASETFFTVSLTRPNPKFPGKIRGCHPLVVGIHNEAWLAGD